MDKVFAKTKAVWVAGRPQKGSYCKQFWVAWGSSVAEAARMADESRDKADFGDIPLGGSSRITRYVLHQEDSSWCMAFVRTLLTYNFVLQRKLDVILPEECSQSYSRLVQQDYVDDGSTVDYTIRNVPDDRKAEARVPVADLLVRINMTRDSMDEDEDNLIPINISAIGCIFLEFTNALSDHLVRTFLTTRTILFKYPFRIQHSLRYSLVSMLGLG